MKLLRLALAALPIAMLSVAVPFVNQLEPRIFGLPFVFAWIIAWVALTPLCIYAIYKMEGRT